MRLDPSDLCVTERPETGRVPVECGKRTGRLRHPEIKIGELSGKLVEVILARRWSCSAIRVARSME